jgi:hypothetical protein
MSKGSWMRPRQVEYETYAENYTRTFEKQMWYNQCPACGSHFDTIPDGPCERADCPFRGKELDDSVYDDPEDK